jgi:hypothetical protein
MAKTVKKNSAITNAMTEFNRGKTARKSSFLSTLLDCRVDAYPFPVFPEFLKGNNTVDFGKQGIIPSTSDIGSGMDLGTELSNDNISGTHDLAAESFYPSPLTFTVASVS